jgi:CheY-like chemotaxis protein
MATERPATQVKRILVVEDEPMIRMLLEDMLGELGYTIAAEAARIEEALVATKNADFDLAILDADLNGQPASPVADALVTRGTAVRLCHGLWQRARALSGPADADEAVSDRWAQAIATERARIAVVSIFFYVGDTWEGEGAQGGCISAPLAF